MKIGLKIILFFSICLYLSSCRSGKRVHTGLFTIEERKFDPSELSTWGFPHISRLQSDTVIRIWIERIFEPLEILTISKYPGDYYCEYVVYGINHKKPWWTKRKTKPVDVYNQIELVPIQGWEMFIEEFKATDIYTISSSSHLDCSKYPVCLPTYYTIEIYKNGLITTLNFYSLHSLGYKLPKKGEYEKIVDLLDKSFVPLIEKAEKNADKKNFFD